MQKYSKISQNPARMAPERLANRLVVGSPDRGFLARDRALGERRKYTRDSAARRAGSRWVSVYLCGTPTCGTEKARLFQQVERLVENSFSCP